MPLWQDFEKKKEIELSAEERAKRRKKNIGIYFLCVLICVLELICIYHPFRDIHAIIGMDKDGNIIYSEEKLGTKEFDIDVSGKITILVEAENHEGSFSFE